MTRTGDAADTDLLSTAVHQNPSWSVDGAMERLFTFAFRGLVYPQIWEDPDVDMEAMELGPDKRMLVIASGGCNAMSYLRDNPKEIVAVDLNPAHVALLRFKVAAAQHLPDYKTYFDMFGAANKASNVDAYDTYVAEHLDKTSREYWDAMRPRGHRRIEGFAQNFYRYGLLGRFITSGHMLARLFGKNPARMMEARSIEEQREIYKTDLEPLFKKRLVRAILGYRASLFGLGIPPAQFEALAGDRLMVDVVRERLERLATGFDFKDNYFAWQAFNRGYATDGKGPLPPYLQEKNYALIRERASRITVENTSLTLRLKSEPSESFDRYVFLDAQDWMDDAVLTELWQEVTRTAKPGARVIYRTAGEETILPGRVPDDVLSRWHYDPARSRALHDKDRSAIYGGFHLYVLK
ncbi:MAG: DUF3419 family protein [Hyphomicrobium sp.]|nr:DUF3419 family protein [Hyphomicrobium sp.]